MSVPNSNPNLGAVTLGANTTVETGAGNSLGSQLITLDSGSTLAPQTTQTVSSPLQIGTLSSDTATIAPAANTITTVAGSVSGPGTLDIGGLGKTILTQPSTNLSGVNVASGATAQSNVAGGFNAPIQLTGNSTLAVSGTNQTLPPISVGPAATDTANVDASPNVTATLTGLSGPGGVDFGGGGTIDLTGPSTVSSLSVGNGTTLGISTPGALSGPLNLGSGSTLDANANNMVINTPIDVDQGGASVNVPSGEVLYVDAPVSGGPLTVTGGGEVVFEQPNSESGLIVTGGSTAQSDVQGGFGNGPIQLAGNSTVALGGTNQTLPNNISSGPNATNVGNVNTLPGLTTTLTGSLSGPGRIAFGGGGTVIVPNSNPNLGAVTLGANTTVETDAGNSLGSQLITLDSGSTLAPQTTQTISSPLQIGTLSSDTATIAPAANTITTVAGSVSGPGTLDIGGLGKTILTQPSTNLSGVNVASGATAQSNVAGGFNAPIQLTGNSTLAVSGTNQTLPPISVGPAATDNANVDASPNVTATLTGLSGPGGVDFGGGGTIDLTRPSTVSSLSVGSGTTLGISTPGALSGPLNLGSGSTLDANANNMVINTPIDVDQGGASVNVPSGEVLYVDAPVSGGPLTVTGGGEVVFEQPNSESGLIVTGGSTVAVSQDNQLGVPGGTVTLNNGTLEALNTLETDRNITLGTQGGTIDVDAGKIMTDNGLISGSGGLTTGGGGKLILTQDETYTGQTNVNNILQLGNQTPGGSLAGNVVIGPNGQLVFDNSIDKTFPGNVSGLGPIVKEGGNTLTLTGDITNAGGIKIEDGNVNLGVTASLTGPIALDNPTSNLIVTTVAGMNQVLPGDITGPGGFIKKGDGEVTVNGIASYCGPTLVLVEGGSMVVNGELPCSSVTTENGATFSAQGKLNNMNIGPNSQLNLTGSPVSTLQISGNVTLGAGSTYNVRLLPNGTSDQLTVGGVANIQGANIGVWPLLNYTQYSPIQTYSIIVAAGGVKGTIATVNLLSNLAFFNVAVNYDANHLYLILARTDITVASLGIATGQQDVGAAVDSLGIGNPIYDALMGASSSDVSNDLTQLEGGSIHPTVLTVINDTSAQLNQVIARQQRFPTSGEESSEHPALTYGAAPSYGSFGSKKGKTWDIKVWGQGFGSWSRRSAQDNAAALHYSNGGFFAGAEAALNDKWKAGVAGGYSNNNLQSTGVGSKGTIGDVEVAAYLAGSARPFNVRLGAQLGHQQIEIKRTIAFPGYNDQTQATYPGYMFQLLGELGYEWRYKKINIEPYGGVRILYHEANSFVEQGGPAALEGGKTQTKMTFGSVGVHVSYPIMLRGIHEVLLYNTWAWQYGFGTDNPRTLLSFVSGSTPFTAVGLPFANNMLMTETGIQWKFSRRGGLTLLYGGLFASKAYNQSIKAVIRWGF